MAPKGRKHTVSDKAARTCVKRLEIDNIGGALLALSSAARSPLLCLTTWGYLEGIVTSVVPNVFRSAAMKEEVVRRVYPVLLHELRMRVLRALQDELKAERLNEGQEVLALPIWLECE